MRFFAAFLTVCVWSSTALAFEGELRATLSSPQGVAAEIRARYGKDGDVRMDLQSSDAEGKPVLQTTIMPAEGSDYYTIDQQRKIVVEMPYSALANTSHQVTGTVENTELEVKKLGKETVSGVETQHVRIFDKDNDTVIDLWLTQKYPPDLWTRAFRGRHLGLEMSDDERTKAMMKYGIKPGFSMKMRVERAGGVPVVFLVKEVKRAAVPPAVFELPEGYQRIQGPAAPRP